jgi:hypothetical protein
LSRLGKFFSEIHPKVAVASLVSALATAFAPMLPSIIRTGTVSVTRGQLLLAVLVGFLTFLFGWLKKGPQTALAITAEDLVAKVLHALPGVSLTAPPPSVAELKDLVVAASKEAITAHVAGLVALAAKPSVTLTSGTGTMTATTPAGVIVTGLKQPAESVVGEVAKDVPADVAEVAKAIVPPFPPAVP